MQTEHIVDTLDRGHPLQPRNWDILLACSMCLGMPWKETDPMKERVKFALEWERRWNKGKGVVNMSALCRVFGVSRPTGYKWIKRYQESGHDVRSLEEQTRRPLTSPTAVDEEMESRVVAARKAHPRWGPRKLRAWLVDQHPRIEFPSASCMGDILKRHGLTRVRRKRKRSAPVPSSQPFGMIDRPNALWCIDFKGKFRLGDGHWCHVLTILDAYSRFLIRCEALLDPTGEEVERIVDSAFLEFGLPAAFRSDNGPPFASTGAGGLTKLSVWWLKLGIRLERIVPGKPHQNGRQERAHLSLEEVVTPPSANLRAQQRAIDLWRKEYNEERPHEALKQKTPLSIYEPSSRFYPRKPIRPTYEFWHDVLLVQKNGSVIWEDHKIHISSALEGEEIVFEQLNPMQDENRIFDVRFGDVLLGQVNEKRLDRGLILPRRRRGDASVSTMSLSKS